MLVPTSASDHCSASCCFTSFGDFWREYLPRLQAATWYLLKYERAASIATAPRRYTAPLGELEFDEIRQLEAAGRLPRSAGRPGAWWDPPNTGVADEGHRHVRDYRAAVEQLAAQAYGPSATERLHHAILNGRLIADVAGLAAPTGAAASAMLALVAGGSVATNSAMHAVQEWRVALGGRRRADRFGFARDVV